MLVAHYYGNRKKELVGVIKKMLSFGSSDLKAQNGRHIIARVGLFGDRSSFQRMASSTNIYDKTSGSWSDHAKRYAHLIERLGQEDIE